MKVDLDFETRSLVDLKKVGTTIYSQHPSTKILSLSYRVNNGPVFLVTKGDLQNGSEEIDDLCRLARSERVTFIAHNAFFEQCIWENVLVIRYGFPQIALRRWRCSMAKAAFFALPMDLFRAAKALSCKALKDKKGHGIMLKMSKPRKPSKNNPAIWHDNPEDYELLYEYNKQDVLAESEVDSKLLDLQPWEQEIWFLDQTINHRGVQIDTRSVQKAISYIKLYSKRLEEEFVRLTDGIVDSVAELKKFIDWAKTQGVSFPNMQAETITEFLGYDWIPDNVRRGLEIRQALSKTSLAKYPAMLERTDNDGILREIIAYCAASTRRWGGRGVQLQNLPRGTINSDLCIQVMNEFDFDTFEWLYEDVLGALSACLRGMIIAREGKRLLVGDYKAIEAVILAWLTEEENLLRLFREGKDPYKWMASKIFNKLQEAIDKYERFVGKSAVLGCGYQMGPPRFTDQYGVSEDMGEHCVSTYRTSFPKIPQFWKDIEAAAIAAVVTGRRQPISKLVWFTHKDFLHCRLPSGSFISYFKPVVKEVYVKKHDFYKEALTFQGTSSKTKQFCEQTTYGGMLTENIVQAISRDLMADGLLNLEAAGYPVILTVHDEGVCERDIGEGSLEEFTNIMKTVPPWAEGLPVEVEAWEGTRYRK